MGDAGLILGWEDLLEEEITTHSSIPSWKIPWKGGLGRLHPWGLKESDTTEATEHECNLLL